MGGILFLNSAFRKFIIVIRKARTRFTYKLFLTLPPIPIHYLERIEYPASGIGPSALHLPSSVRLPDTLLSL